MDLFRSAGFPCKTFVPFFGQAPGHFRSLPGQNVPFQGVGDEVVASPASAVKR